MAPFALTFTVGSPYVPFYLGAFAFALPFPGIFSGCVLPIGWVLTKMLRPQRLTLINLLNSALSP